MATDVIAQTAVSGYSSVCPRGPGPDMASQKNIPSVSECLRLLSDTFKADAELMRHSRKVAQTAVLLGEMLNHRGWSLDLKLVEAAALLHDMARCLPNHAHIAGEFLRKLDYPDVAEIVEAHMNPEIRNPEKITEIDVVSFSDRLVLGDQLVRLEVRFSRQLVKHLLNPEATIMIQHRLNLVRNTWTAFEDALGTKLENLFPELSE